MGDREIWEITESSDSLVATSWRRSASSNSWDRSEHHLTSHSLLDAIVEVPELHQISGVVVTRILTSSDAITEEGVLATLKIVGQEVEPDDWPESVSENWLDLDDYLIQIDGLLWHYVWTSLDSHPVLGVSLENEGIADPIPALIDFDENPPIRAHIIGEYSWFSESGGAPISWDGGSQISRLRGSLGFEGQFGDEGNDWKAIVLPEEESEMAELLRGWIEECEAEVTAAISFEKLDPHETLSDSAREEWTDLIEAFVRSARVWLDVAPGTFDLLRATLTENERYSRTCEALRNPGDTLGSRLHKALSDFAEDGVLGPVELEDWNDSSVEREG